MGQFLNQMQALVVKNLLVVVVRSPIGFILTLYALPLALLAVLISIPSFLSTESKYGVASPAPIRSFADTVHKKLVIIKHPGLGNDIDRVIKTFTEPLDQSKILFLDDESTLGTVCLANLRGVSDCHASVTFIDSPGTKVSVDGAASKRHTWQYTVRADPAQDSSNFDATAHTSPQETLFLPLQLAIDNAITNSNTTPEVFMFTREKQVDKEKKKLERDVALVTQKYPFALFACYLFLVYRFTSFITNERESGMAQLIDSMGGGRSIVARVFSWLIVFDLVCLPCYIAFGALYKRILFKSASVGILIGWQILLGFAVNSSAVFAAAFFKKSRVSSIYIAGVFLLLSVAAQIYSFQLIPTLPGPEGVYPLTIIFPSANSVFFAQLMALWELSGQKADLNKMPKEADGINSSSYGVTQAAMLGFLVLNIFLYPILAIVVEHYMHGIDFRKRTFTNGRSDTSEPVVEAFDLRKKFIPTFLERVFCCGKRKPFTAVDGVSFQGYKGQILCLLGPNGSGKTTTLQMMSGFYRPTAGSVKLNATPSQMGICPQTNTLWHNLTVKEHIYLWSKIKAGYESASEIDNLIASCDLELKRDTLAKNLSGGQKRKLQLACMFVGNSTVCLVDECTSGLDPLSRRIIWDILMEQRSKRSIVFTTHFLDEVDVLADHIVILLKGKVRCQGAATELKHQYGGGYKVIVPLSAPKMDIEYPTSYHQDTVVYTTPDSRAAAQLTSRLAAIGVLDATISGPQVEDVFLRVADEPDLQQPDSSISNIGSGFEMSPGRTISFWSQVTVLLRKRLTILRRFWWPYFYVLALPLVITPFLKNLVKKYEIQSCANFQSDVINSVPQSFYYDAYCTQQDFCDTFAIGPKSANGTLYDLAKQNISAFQSVDMNYYGKFVKVFDNRDKFVDFISQNRSFGPGGIYMGSGDQAPVIGYRIFDYGQPYGFMLNNLWSQMHSKTKIIAAVGGFAKKEKEGPDDDTLLSGIVFAMIFCLIQAIYPAVFTLYPAIEKDRKVRAIQYANGVRRAPLWVAYGSFDFFFVLVLAIGVTLIIQSYLVWNGPILIMMIILALYGLAAILLGYVVAHFASGPLGAFMSMMAINLLMYAVSAIAFGVGSAYSSAAQMDTITLGIAFGLNVILPIGNVFRAVVIGLNVVQTGCRDGAPTPVGSIYGFGGPILYLVLQVAALLLIIVWIEGDVAVFGRNGSRHIKDDSEKDLGFSSSQEVEAEKIRVEQSDTDLLRVLHLKKRFGSNQAVDNVSFGLAQSDTMALIGPNGAGKSTLVNLIQSELSPDQGRVLLNNEDARQRSTQKYLGVCPQYDALDLMTTREQLSFFARVKGVKDVRGNVNHVMEKLNLAPHASTPTSKLSGGNKRKLSLAIALMGTPPVLVLDEPTSAMDAVAKRSFWKIIQSIARGRAVLLTTHSMEEADTLANRTAIISQRLLAVGSTQSLREKYSNVYYVSLLLSSAPNSTFDEMSYVRSWIQDRVPGSDLEREMLGGQIRFTIPGVDGNGQRPVAGLIHMLEENKGAMGIEYYSVGGATLENVFLSVVRENNVKEEDGKAPNRVSRVIQGVLRR